VRWHGRRGCAGSRPRSSWQCHVAGGQGRQGGGKGGGKGARPGAGAGGGAKGSTSSSLVMPGWGDNVPNLDEWAELDEVCDDGTRGKLGALCMLGKQQGGEEGGSRILGVRPLMEEDYGIPSEGGATGPGTDPTTAPALPLPLPLPLPLLLSLSPVTAPAPALHLRLLRLRLSREGQGRPCWRRPWWGCRWRTKGGGEEGKGRRRIGWK